MSAGSSSLIIEGSLEATLPKAIKQSFNEANDKPYIEEHWAECVRSMESSLGQPYWGC